MSDSDEKDDMSTAERTAWLEHQFAELDREALDADTITKLQADHRRLAHATDLITACEATFARVGGDEGPSLTRLLQQARYDLQRVSEHEPRLLDVDAMLDNAAIQIDEALERLCESRGESLEVRNYLLGAIEALREGAVPTAPLALWSVGRDKWLDYVRDDLTGYIALGGATVGGVIALAVGDSVDGILKARRAARQ